jgi:hypothetical protein
MISQMAANDKAWLEDHQITHILTIVEGSNPAYPEVYIFVITTYFIKSDY